MPLNTLRYWVHGGGSVPPWIKLAGTEPLRLSFANLLECYMLSSMRAIYDVRIPKVRKSLTTLARYVQHRHRWWSKLSKPIAATCSLSTLARL